MGGVKWREGMLRKDKMRGQIERCDERDVVRGKREGTLRGVKLRGVMRGVRWREGTLKGVH